MLNLIKNKKINYIWDNIEKTKPKPNYCTGIVKESFKNFCERFKSEESLKNTVNEILDGKVFLIKSCYTKEFINRLKDSFNHFVLSKPSNFHKMLEGCPDFHRVIDEGVSNLYAVSVIKHSAYFFNWNGDPYKLFPEIYDKWRLLKFLGGRYYNEFESNTPRDGVVDRIQILKYPSGGKMDLHCDPDHNQKLFISLYMSKREKNGDYEEGGFYLLDNKKEIIDLEDHVDVGDLGFGYATLMHGVKTINHSRLKKNNANFSSKSGRWYLGLYSNDSDEIKNRKTSIQIKN